MALVIFEDEHLLVIDKPAGINTHSPSPFAGEGIYEWLKNREPRWANLAIIHRLDKETSGVMVFGKTTLANRSLTKQFSDRTVHKKYILATDRAVKFNELKAESVLVRAGEKYISRPDHAGGERAETVFRKLKSSDGSKNIFVEAEPITGKTHQIRAHAAAHGFPILGDALYGGTAAPQVFLHASELSFEHPATGKVIAFSRPPNFEEESRLALRATLIEPDLIVAADVRRRIRSLTGEIRLLTSAATISKTNAYRLIHGAADGWPGWYVERLGDFLLSQSESPQSVVSSSQERRGTAAHPEPGAAFDGARMARSVLECGGPPPLCAELHPAQHEILEKLLRKFSLRGAHHKILKRRVGQISSRDASPQFVLGEVAPDPFLISENGIQFALSFNEGYSVGLFLDQRENRRRFLTHYIAPNFSVAAACDRRGTAENQRRSQTAATSEGAIEVLNAFSYTCGFSVCAAKAGATVTSLDLSKKYLEWGKRNFVLNEIDPARHEFIFGDAFDWMKRLAKKQRQFDVIILDPPTFSQSKEQGTFRVEKDFGKLVSVALPLLKSGGILFASTNAANWKPEDFLETIYNATNRAKRKILQQHYVPQPPDFPISREEPGYLKTVWLKIS